MWDVIQGESDGQEVYPLNSVKSCKFFWGGESAERRERLVLTLRIFAPWRLCVSLSLDVDLFTQRRKAAKKNRKDKTTDGLELFSDR